MALFVETAQRSRAQDVTDLLRRPPPSAPEERARFPLLDSAAGAQSHAGEPKGPPAASLDETVPALYGPWVILGVPYELLLEGKRLLRISGRPPRHWTPSRRWAARRLGRDAQGRRVSR